MVVAMFDTIALFPLSLSLSGVQVHRRRRVHGQDERRVVDDARIFAENHCQQLHTLNSTPFNSRETRDEEPLTALIPDS